MTALAPTRLELAADGICEWCACGNPAVALMIGSKLSICAGAARSTIVIPKPRKRPPRPGHIYFIQAGESGPVKIGWSLNDPFGRLAFFQTGHWETLRIVRELPGTVGEERALHSRFAEHQIRNEWFKPIVLELFERQREWDVFS